MIQVSEEEQIKETKNDRKPYQHVVPHLLSLLENPSGDDTLVLIVSNQTR